LSQSHDKSQGLYVGARWWGGCHDSEDKSSCSGGSIRHEHEKQKLVPTLGRSFIGSAVQNSSFNLFYRLE
jgi:hypothetical protein